MGEQSHLNTLVTMWYNWLKLCIFIVIQVVWVEVTGILPLYKCLAHEHAFPNLGHDVPSVIFAHQDDSPSSPAHTACTT